MIQIPENRLRHLSKSFEGKKVAVIGDMMLDCYFWGDVKRISPEAPVPIVEIENEFARFGGAANVALNILKLGGIPVPIGVMGRDNDGRILSELLEDAGISSDGICEDKTRPTTCKTRVIAHDQHVVRIDKESKEYISPKMEKELIEYLEKNIKSLDAIILEDYNKGVLTTNLITTAIQLAKENKKIITVDPKFNNFFLYKDVTVFKPNRKESEDALGTKIKNDDDLSNAGKNLIERLNPEYLLLTLGEDGIAIFEQEGSEKRMPTKARVVADVSGAGDTVISTLTMALASGADIYESCYLGNYAGGIVCEQVGVVPIEKETLFNTIIEDCK